MSTPAEVIRQLLIDLNLGQNSPSVDWAVYVNLMRDGEIGSDSSGVVWAKDKAIAVFNTQGIFDGRLMTNGEQTEHPGIQIRVRGDHIEATAWNKANDIALRLDSISNTEITVDTDNVYRLRNFSRTSPIIPLGIDDEGDRLRYVFTINAVLTLDPV